MTQGVADTPTRIALSGSTGLVGSALSRLLTEQGRDVRLIVRAAAGGEHEILWDTTHHGFDEQALAECDAVVHLAGENIMGRWTDEKKRRIRDSRIDSTRGLSETLAKLAKQGRGPRTLIVASAVGYYGDTDKTDARTEDDPPGTGFLSEVCVQWERAADAARQAGLRVVHVRIGVVLSPDGGALKQMLLPFQLGLGGPVGSGDQYMSWIGLHDLARIFAFCLDTHEVTGPVNAVAPEPVTNQQFTQTLGEILHRPTLLPAPAFALRLLYGRQCADGIVLASIRVKPKRLIDAGFTFDHSDLGDALRHELHP